MQGLTESRPEPEAGTGTLAEGLPLIPRPGPLGYFFIPAAALAFAGGRLGDGLPLTLLGAVFLTVTAYCFLGVFFAGLLNRRKIRQLSISIVTETVQAGKEGELWIKTGGLSAGAGRFFRPPAVLVRSALLLGTRDGRVISHFAGPGLGGYSRFPVKERGAYFPGFQAGGGGRFDVFDAPGLFRLSFPVRRDGNLRLLAFPSPAGETVPFTPRPGGAGQHPGPRFRKSGGLTDHRPYIPGDDPRRINWKLYGHGPQGELFVREGEPEPPPHPRLLVLIDTEADRALYSLEDARRAVDLLCSNALAVVLELSAGGMDILTGYTGGGITGSLDGNGPLNAAEAAAVFAWPAAVPWPAPSAVSGVESPSKPEGPRRPAGPPGDLPEAPPDRGVLIFALPRSSTGTSALDRFLKNRGAQGQGTDIVFLYSTEDGQALPLEESARACVNLYNRRPGIRARRSAVPAIIEGRPAARPDR